MENFSGWIREIVTLLLFVVFLELLIPRTSMEPLIRVVAGLLILVTILKPVVVWIHDFHPMEMTLNGRQIEVSGTERNPMGFLKAAYEQGMMHRIKTYLTERGYGGQEVSVKMRTEADKLTVSSVTIVVSAADLEAVRTDICRTFDLPEAAVTIKQGGR